MGDPRKQRRTYETPRHPWRKEQLDEELRLLGEYGLRNKHELRRHETMLSKIRGIARSLLGATEEERSRIEKQYLARLTKLGILQTEATVDNILDLDVKDLMERRLQTMVYREGLAKSIHQARQFVTHGHISIEGKTVSVPGYIVRKAEEAKITFHERSPLNNAQHPARGTAGESRKSGLLVEPVAQEGPRLPEVSREIQEAAKAEQPLVMEPVTEEAPPTVEKE